MVGGIILLETFRISQQQIQHNLTAVDDCNTSDDTVVDPVGKSKKVHNVLYPGFWVREDKFICYTPYPFL